MTNLHTLFDIEVPTYEPFKYDVLGRKFFAEALLNVINTYKGGAVIGLNGKWGSGKSTFVEMFRSWLELNDDHTPFCTAYLNAWEHEYLGDPTLAMLSCVQSLLPNENEDYVQASSKWSGVNDCLQTLRRSVINNVISKVSFGLISPDAVDKACDQINKASKTNYLYRSSDIAAYQQEYGAFKLFKESLEEYIGAIAEISRNPVIIFIDELDRCNPSYAVSLLERIKHLFSTENAIFILSIDKDELCHSICGYYGSDNFSAKEYLRRFIDIDISMPFKLSTQFSKTTVDRLGLLSENFIRHDHLDHIADAITLISSNKNLTLRQIQKILTLGAMSFRKIRADFMSFFISLPLAYIKVFEPQIFDKIYKKEFSMKELHKFLTPIYLNVKERREDYFLTFLCLYQNYCSNLGQPKENHRCFDDEFKYVFEDTFDQSIVQFAQSKSNMWDLNYILDAINMYDELIG